MDWEKLKEPFEAKDIEWRIGQSGKGAKGPWAKVLAYMTSRAVMDRLDEVCGPDNWWDSFTQIPGCEGGVECTLHIRSETNGWVSKTDAAPFTQIESIKGGYSDALKRCAVKWGIGRYLYHLEEGWAEIVQKGTKGAHYAKTKDGEAFYWLPPQLPSWALPGGSEQTSKTETSRDGPSYEFKSAPKGDATEQQIKKIRAQAKQLGYSSEVCKDMFQTRWGITSHNQLTKDMASKVIEGFNKQLHKAHEDQGEYEAEERRRAQDADAELQSFDGGGFPEETPPKKSTQHTETTDLQSHRKYVRQLLNSAIDKGLDPSIVFRKKEPFKAIMGADADKLALWENDLVALLK